MDKDTTEHGHFNAEGARPQIRHWSKSTVEKWKGYS